MIHLNKRIASICAAVALTAALIVPASALSTVEQMAANSAAWWVAFYAGDTAAMDALHAENERLAAQAAGSSGSSSYNSEAGTWDINTSSGTNYSSSSTLSGKSTTVTYDCSDGRTQSPSSHSYSNDSIDAYYDYGGTTDGLVTSYNNAADKTAEGSLHGSYLDETTNKVNYERGAEIEANVIREKFGLTEAQAADLQSRLLAEKKEYNDASQAHTEAVKAGNMEEAARLEAIMAEHHAAAEAVRNEYGYTGDRNTADGGFLVDEHSGSEDIFVVDPDKIVRTYEIEVSCGTGGTATPSGIVYVKEGDSKTVTITPDTDYTIARVLVDGTNVGAVGSYTFSNVTSAHKIRAEFAQDGKISIGDIAITDAKGADLTAHGATIKSGYGIFANVPISAKGVSNVTVTCKYDFKTAGGKGTVTLTDNGNGTYSFPVEATSVTGAKCVYIPVDAKDKTYPLTFTVTAKDGKGATLSDTASVSITVKGSMYEDDFTGGGKK